MNTDPSALDLARQLPGAAEDVYKALDKAAYLLATGPLLAEDVERLWAVQPLLRALIAQAAQVQMAAAAEARRLEAELAARLAFVELDEPEGCADAVIHD